MRHCGAAYAAKRSQDDVEEARRLKPGIKATLATSLEGEGGSGGYDGK